MLISVLLPTRDRLEYLRYAVESVVRQDDGEWEIVVSDNDSAEDIAGYVEGLGDSRIRYVRTDQLVPVTENWNNALRNSTGEYTVMLGDDDALLPGYLSSMRALIERFEHPDAIYTGAFLYAYPGVLPDVPDGYLQPNLHAPFFAGADEPFMLDRRATRELARAAADFRALYDFNMQYVLVRRATADRLAAGGDFFRSPFPDYYAMNLLFAEAERIAVDPRPRVVIGITRRSYGFFHFNRREADARALLHTDQVEPEIRRELEPVVLPGTNINTSWLLAMESLYRRLGSPQDMRPNYARYRRLQAIYCEQAHHIHRTIGADDLRLAEAGLAPGERRMLRLAGPAGGALLRVTPPGVRRRAGAVFDRVVGQYGRITQPEREVGGYRDVLEVLDRFENGAAPRPGVTAGVACPMCGGRATTALRAWDRNRRLSDETFTYHRCSRCGTLALDPVPADLDRYYPPAYYAVPRGRDELRSAAGPERYKLEIVRRFAPGGRLVEIGPAVGGFALVMQDAGYETSAIEMDAECCRFLREVLGISVQETTDPIAALAAGGPFDVVAMWHVIEHLPNPREVLAAVARSLAPGGIVALAAPNPEAFQFRVLGSRWTHLDAPRHLVLIPADELARLGRELGLEAVLLTTLDAGTLAWNHFGWRESLAGFAQGRYVRFGLRLLGSLLARAMAPLDRRELRGSTYTLVLRRPAA
ncbi:MAG: methyltransferase domain-containing protein [Solirubrobacteraceae bacterium]